MADIKFIFVACAFLFCLLINGCAQQYEAQGVEFQANNWQSTRSRLRGRGSIRSVDSSSLQIPDNSSPDVTTRSRQRIRGRNIPEPTGEGQYKYEAIQDPILGERNPNFRSRSNIKTLEDSLNTEKYQKRPQRRNGYVDVTDVPFTRQENDVPTTKREGARSRSDGTFRDVRQRNRGRSRATVEDVTEAKPSRTRGFTSRYQDVEPTKPRREFTVQAQQVNQELSADVPISGFAQTNQQVLPNAPLLQQSQQQIPVKPVDAVFPNLSTQQFSTDPAQQFARRSDTPVDVVPNQQLPTGYGVQDSALQQTVEQNTQPDPTQRGRTRGRVTYQTTQEGAVNTPTQRNRGRQVSFRSRTKVVETTTPFATSTETSTTTQTRNSFRTFRGRSRLNAEQASDRVFTGDLQPETPKPVRPSRGNGKEAKDEDIDETANYPKEFLDKLKSSKAYTSSSKVTFRSKRRQTPTTTPKIDTSETDTKETHEEPSTQRSRYSQRFYKNLSARTEEPRQEDTERSVEERRKFVPKKKLTVEERKERISRLKEKLQKNATEDELKPEESKEWEVKESLVTQANTYPGSREVFPTEKVKSTVEVKSSVSSNVKRVKKQRGQTKFRDDSKDLIPLASEEQLVVVKNETSTKNPTKKSTTKKPPSTTRIPRTVTTPRPVATTQATSSTTKGDFAVLNVTLFPSTRHRFSARINSSATLSLPPDVELVSSTTPSTVISTPDAIPPLEIKPELTLSVNKLFNTSINSTNTSVAATSTSDPSTTTTTTTTTTPRSTTTRRSSSKKKSSGKKKSKKSKSGRTTTKKPKSPRPSTTTVRPASNSTGVLPLSLAFSDIETIINETAKIVNSNSISGPSGGAVPRSELNALTPETILNGTTETTTTSDAPTTTARANTNSSVNSTNNADLPARLTDTQCSNGTCTKSKSQSLFFNEDNSNREPLPYARQKATTKSPESLRKIFIYGVFPNNTVQRRPFPGDGDRSPSRYYNRPTTSLPPYTSGDYFVFGVYPNNSVVRRRGWKTFDYEKYRSPYVIFGIYPNNTIIKKFPNGTTINDGVMVSDSGVDGNNVYRNNGNVYCTCADPGHQNVIPHRPALTTSTTTPATTTTTSTTPMTTTTTTETPEEGTEAEGGEGTEAEGGEGTEAEGGEGTEAEGGEGTEAEGGEGTEAEGGEGTEAEGGEGTEAEGGEGTEAEGGEGTEAEGGEGTEAEGEEGTKAEGEEGGEGDEGAEEGQGEEEEAEEEEGGGEEENPERNPKDEVESVDIESENISETETPTEETTEESTDAPSVELGQTTPRTLEEAEEADLQSTTTETTRLEEAEEADNESTPSSFEDATVSSLEREETQNAGVEDAEEADSKEPDTLNIAENVDEKTTTEGSTNSENQADSEEERENENLEETTESNERLQENTTVESNDTTESIQGASEGNEEEGVEKSENLAEGLEQTSEGIENLNESATGVSDEESVTEIGGVAEDRTENYFTQSQTTERSEDLSETAEENESLGEPTEESTTERSENLRESTEENESLAEPTEESTTERNEYFRESTEESLGEPTEESTTERSENLRESTESSFTERNESLGEPTEDSTTERRENLRESTEKDESFGEPTEESIAENNDNLKEPIEENETLVEPTEESEKLRETTEETEYRTERPSANVEEESSFGITERPESLDRPEGYLYGPGAAEEQTDFGTTERSNRYEEQTPNYLYELSVGDRNEGTTERSENLQGETEGYFNERTTERSERLEERTERYEFTTERSERVEEQAPRESEQIRERNEEGAVEGAVTERNEGLQQSVDDVTNTERSFADVQRVDTTSAEGYLSERTTQTYVNSFAEEDIREVGELKSPQRTTQRPDENTIPVQVIYEEYADYKTGTEATPSKVEVDEDAREVEVLKGVTATTQRPDENTIPVQVIYDGYSYERPTGRPFTYEDVLGKGSDGFGETVTPAAVETTREDAAETTDFDIDVRELGNLISRLTTAMFGEVTPPTDSTVAASSRETSTDLLEALLPLSIEYIQSSASGNQVKKRQRKSLNNLDEPSSLTNLAYRSLSSPEITSTPIPILTTTTTTTTTTTKVSLSTPATRFKPKKVKNYSKTTVTAYKHLTNLTSTPRPDEVIIVTPVGSTRENPDADYVRRGKVKFVTLTPGVVVTTNIHDENDILTMSSQHVQKVTKAPAKIPDNFLSTVFGEIEEKASSPIPDIIKNVENDLQGDGLSASLARRIITLALEKAMTSTTPVSPVTSQQSTTTITTKPPTTTPYRQPTLAPLRLTTLEPTTTTTTTTTRRPTTTKRPTSTRRPIEVSTKSPVAVKPVTSTTRRPRTTSTTIPSVTEQTREILITPKKAQAQLSKKPAPLVTSPEFLLSTLGPDVTDGRTAVEVPVALEPLNVLFASDVSSTTRAPASTQTPTEDLNVLLSGLFQADTSTAKVSESPTKVKQRPKSNRQKSSLSKQASNSLSESDLKLLEAILQQQVGSGVVGGASAAAKGGAGGGGGQDLEQIVQNQIRLAEEVRKASKNLRKKPRPSTTTTTERATPLGLGFLLNLLGSGSRPNGPGLFANEVRNSRRQRPTAAPSFITLTNTSQVSPDPFNELDSEGTATGERSVRGELVSAAIDVTKAVSKFMGTVLTSAAASFQNLFRNLGR